MSGLQGGSYKTGFLTGAASSMLGSVTNNLDPAFQIGSSAVFGGTVAELSGGNFWRGAAQSAIVAGLNHAAHSITDNDEESDKNLKIKGILDFKREPYEGFLGKAEYFWTGGNENGIRYDLDGNAIGLSPITGDAPSIGSVKGGYTLIKQIGKFNVWQKTVKASTMSGQARSVMTQMRTQSGKMVKMFKDTYRIDGRFWNRSIKYPFIKGLPKYLK